MTNVGGKEEQPTIAEEIVMKTEVSSSAGMTSLNMLKFWGSIKRQKVILLVGSTASAASCPHLS